MNEDYLSDPENYAEMMTSKPEPDFMDAGRELREQLRKAFEDSAKLGDLLAGNTTEPSE